VGSPSVQVTEASAAVVVTETPPDATVTLG